MTAAIVLAQHGDRTVAMGKTTREDFFCRCVGCSQIFLVEHETATPELEKYLEEIAARTKGAEPKQRSSERRFPVEYVDALAGLPAEVDAFYREATAALSHELPNAAGAVFRKTMEAATLSEAVINQIPADQHARYRRAKLYDRITTLKDTDVIPKALYAIADIVRTEGNAAVHDLETYTIDEATALKAFTDTFLQHVIVLPSMIASARSARARQAPDAQL
jgi:hypothetical protein